MTGVDAPKVNMDAAILTHATAYRAKFTGSRLANCDFSASRMNDSDFTDADFSYARLNGAWMAGTILVNANLRGSSLFSTRLDRANLTGARLYATNLTGWSVKDVICEFAYWDVGGLEKTRYEPGEFEKLYGSQSWIELAYPGGITTFEVNTLPALIQHLAKQHPSAGIRLKSITEAPGGVKVLLHVEESSSVDVAQVKQDAEQTQQVQLALRDDEMTRLRIENDLMLTKIFPRLLASAQHVTIAGAATNVIIAGSGAVIHNERVHNSAEILALVHEILQRRTDALPEHDADLGKAAETVQSELSSAKPKESVVAKALGVLKEVATKTATSAGEKIITEHWQTWAHQLEHFIRLVSNS